MTAKLIINAAGQSDQGKVRTLNQDCFLVNHQLALYAVADGIEAAKYSEVASRTAVEWLEKMLKDLNLSQDATPPFDDNPGLPLEVRSLKYAFREVNRQIYQMSRDNPKYRGFGTTLTAVWIREGKAFIGHIGDSRAYLIRKSIIQQLTSDHTTLAEKIPDRPRDIELYQEDDNISEHELSRAVGINPDVQVQLGSGALAPGDRFVLCTDGLYGQLRNFEIAQAALHNNPAAACMKLIQMANQRGGQDNIAVVVIAIE